MDDYAQFHLKKVINELKSKRGRHTELITVYLPTGTSTNIVLSQLAQEQGTATNIKSTSTRKNVTDALEKTIQHIRLFKQTPPNGLAVFCGNVSEREGVQDIRLWSIEPPEPINVRIYRCDQVFVTGPLEEIVTPKDVYVLVAIDNKTATVATLKGSRYTIIKKLTSGYHGKHRAGGQSHRRFERIIEEQSHEFKKRVADIVNTSFLQDIQNIRGIVIGGPVATKEEFVEGDYIHHELKKKILAVKDITYTDESGIRELIHASKDTLANVELVRQKSLMDRFLMMVVKDDGLVAYGRTAIDDAIKIGAVDKILVSEGLDDKEIDKYYELSKGTGFSVELVSTDFEEGAQLKNAFGGVVAFLRFRI